MVRIGRLLFVLGWLWILEATGIHVSMLKTYIFRHLKNEGRHSEQMNHTGSAIFAVTTLWHINNIVAIVTDWEYVSYSYNSPSSSISKRLM